jgi:hypothetical protein
MIIRYGNYPFPIGTTGFTIARQTLFTARQEAYGIQEVWNGCSIRAAIATR